MADTTYLELKGRTYWYIRSFPKEWRPWLPPPHTGKANYRQNLKTDSLFRAQALRSGHSAVFDQMLAQAQRSKQLGEVNPLSREAQEYLAFIQSGTGGDEESRRSIVEDLIEDRLPEMERRFGEDAASNFWKKATGNRRGTPIEEYLEKFITENPAKPHTQYKRRNAIGDLANWRSSLTLEGMTTDLARTYVDEVVSPGRKAGTINAVLGVLRGYWRWLEDRGLLKETTLRWGKFRRKEQSKSLEKRERSFTSSEMVMLFHGPVKMRPDLLDFCKVAALTGARQNEVGLLRVKDVNIEDMTVFLPGEKTEAAPRTIPLHPALAEVLRPRCDGKGAEEFVFDTLPVRKAGALKPRSSPMSQAFTRFRRQVGIGFEKGSADRSPVTFHSFRRWFSKVLVELSTPADLVEQICGWRSGGMRERYAWDAKRLEQARTYVNQVQLPSQPD